MQDVVSSVLAELKAKGSSAQIQQESESSTARLEFESFWNEVPSPVNRSIELQSAGPVDQNMTASSGDASR